MAGEKVTSLMLYSTQHPGRCASCYGAHHHRPAIQQVASLNLAQRLPLLEHATPLPPDNLAATDDTTNGALSTPSGRMRIRATRLRPPAATFPSFLSGASPDFGADPPMASHLLQPCSALCTVRLNANSCERADNPAMPPPRTFRSFSHY